MTTALRLRLARRSLATGSNSKGNYSSSSGGVIHRESKGSRHVAGSVARRHVAVHGVAFDLDGTLVEQALDFAQMRHRLQIPPGHDILAVVETMPEPRKTAAMATIEHMEAEAMAKMQLLPGATELLAFLSEQSIPMAIVTRNTIAPVHRMMDITRALFDPIVTRDFKPVKPHPEALLHIAKSWDIEPHQILMVGDSADDILCGKNAGAVTAHVVVQNGNILANNVAAHAKSKGIEADLVVGSLHELLELLKEEQEE